MNRRDVLRNTAFAAVAQWSIATGAHAAEATSTTPADGPLQRPATASRLATQSAMLDMAAAGSRLVAVGERGRILLSDDNGRAWRQADVVPVSVTLTAVTFVGNHGWATGHCGVVLHTVNAGETWQLQLDGARAAALALQQAESMSENTTLARQARQLVADGADKPFLDLDFSSQTKGIVVGAYGLVFSTDDGGTSWRSRIADTDNPKGFHLSAVRSVGSTVLIAGERGLMLRSDGEPHFTALAPLYDGSWFALGASSAQGVTVAGLRGTVFHSSLDGQQWQRVAAGGQTINAVSMVGGHTLLVSQTGAVRLLGRQGAEATVLNLRRTPAPITALVLAADGALVAATLRGPTRLADTFPG